MFDNLLAERRRWLRDLPARTTLKLFNRPSIRRALAYRYNRALLAHQPVLPRLTDSDAQIVSALQRDGIYITTLDALGLAGSSDAVQQANALADSFVAEARGRSAGGQAFVIVPPERIVDYPDIYLLGLQDRLLDIAEAYIGLPPAYDGVTINYTVADGREVSTRKWHRDWEDRQMLKVAIYLHEVDETGGPFQLIRRHDPTHNDQMGFTYELADDAALTHRLGADYHDDVVSCSGPAGTVIFADTARFFHRGKPASDRDRTAVFYSYFAARPRHPFFCERTGMSRDEITRLTVDLPPRQQGAARWRDKLSLLLKLIPQATL
jgi:hypothetical protein